MLQYAYSLTYITPLTNWCEQRINRVGLPTGVPFHPKTALALLLLLLLLSLLLLLLLLFVYDLFTKARLIKMSDYKFNQKPFEENILFKKSTKLSLRTEFIAS